MLTYTAKYKLISSRWNTICPTCPFCVIWNPKERKSKYIRRLQKLVLFSTHWYQNRKFKREIVCLCVHNAQHSTIRKDSDHYLSKWRRWFFIFWKRFIFQAFINFWCFWLKLACNKLSFLIILKAMVYKSFPTTITLNIRNDDLVKKTLWIEIALRRACFQWCTSARTFTILSSHVQRINKLIPTTYVCFLQHMLIWFDLRLII